MATFLTPDSLKREITALFDDAERFLLIVSPYIHIPDNLRRVLSKRLGDKELEIYVLFGKNEDDPSRSLKTDDMLFLQQFQNISIHYHPDLHAKFYANDNRSIVTSLNLHRHSLIRNIEVGVLFQQSRSIFTDRDSSTDAESTNYFMSLIEGDHNPLFKRHVNIKSSFFGLKKERGESRVEVDNTGLSEPRPYRNDGREPSMNTAKSSDRMGYCIRTGIEIPFNLNRPLCDRAYESWAQFGNPDYPEKYCHFSGEPTNGETSYAHPVLGRNWKFVKRH